MVVDFNKKRVRRGESFGRMGVDRTLSNSLKSPSRQKQRSTIVRFAEETPMIYLCSNFDQNMTPVEFEGRKKELWYSREEFEEFLQERIATIRFLQVVQGDAMAFRKHCPDLCLRGLEPYQCSTFNQELQCQRQMHQRAVLTEQTMQKSQKQEPDPDNIRRLAQGRSEWARQRAQQLGVMDEMEVKNASRSLDDTALRRGSLTVGFQNLVLTQRRPSLTSLGLSTPRRVPVDLAILKEWNAKFLQDIRNKNGVGGVAGTSAIPGTTTVTSLSEKTAQSRRALQQGSLMFRGTLTHGSSTGKIPTSSSLGYGEPLAVPSKEPVTRKESAIKESAGLNFRFPVRQDSLVGLRRGSFLANANKKASTKDPDPAPSTNALATLAAAASVVAGGSLTDTCFRFPVRRDSLSNV